jgi:hypothetical protein
VLIEGPADFNPHIEDLRRAHTLPIAIFSYHADATTARASYSPLCVYSPEWLALEASGFWRPRQPVCGSEWPASPLWRVYVGVGTRVGRGRFGCGMGRAD